MKALCAFVLAFVGVGLLIIAITRARHASEEGFEVWFYDERSGKLYEAPIDTIPPDKHGVRAVVVAPRGQPREQKITYLEMFGPALKNVLDSIRAAHRAKAPYTGEVPGRNSPFFRTNSFVRRASDTNWFAADSAEGRKITSEWRAWRGSDGQPLEVCAPQ